jgi:rubrerythrin
LATVFSGDELIKIAIGIETRGITFYDIMAKSSDNDEARAVFEDLVQMERDHLQTFQEILGTAGKGGVEPPSEERLAYLQSLIDTAVFTDDLITSEMATQADSDIKALELAISAEKDSILFYYEMKDELPRNLSPVMEKLIAEEKLHLRQLSEMKKSLASLQ